MPWSNAYSVLAQKIAGFTAIFHGRKHASEPPKDRRKSPIYQRLRTGIWQGYHQATGAAEFDSFSRDAPTWAAFEHAVEPELHKFSFFDCRRQANASPAAALADAMYHIWMLPELGRDLNGRPTTTHVVKEIAHYLCSVYEVSTVDRRNERRGWWQN